MALRRAQGSVMRAALRRECCRRMRMCQRGIRISAGGDIYVLVQFGDHFDLYTTAQRQLRNAECRASVLADIAEYLTD